MLLDLVFPNGQGKVEQLNNIVRRGLLPAQVAAGVAIDSGQVDENRRKMFRTKTFLQAARRDMDATWRPQSPIS